MESNKYENIILNKQNIYYVHKKFDYMLISLNKIKKFSSLHTEITFIKCNDRYFSDFNNKQFGGQIETITYTLEQILTGNDFNIIYLSTKEEINLLKEELNCLLTIRKENNYIDIETIDKIIEKIIKKLNSYESFQREIKDR